MNEHVELKTNPEIAMYLHVIGYCIIILLYTVTILFIVMYVYILCQLAWLTFAILEFYSLISYHIQLFAEYKK